MNKRIKKAFTLAEVLLAMAIVGVIAVLTVPALMNNVTNKVFANQAKNMSATIEQLANDELVAKQTRDLSNTDFAQADTLLTSKHFSISEKCSEDENNNNTCWKNNYKKLNNIKSSIGNPGETIILTNGVMLAYTPQDNSGKTVGRIYIDVNGKDKPNIYGRDVFAFYVTPRGSIADNSILSDTDVSLETKISDCKGGNPFSCFGALRDNNWKMKY